MRDPDVSFHWLVICQSDLKHSLTERTLLVDGRHRVPLDSNLLLPLNGDEVLGVGRSMLNPSGMDGLVLAMRDGPHTAVADRGPHCLAPLSIYKLNTC